MQGRGGGTGRTTFWAKRLNMFLKEYPLQAKSAPKN